MSPEDNGEYVMRRPWLNNLVMWAATPSGELLDMGKFVRLNESNRHRAKPRLNVSAGTSSRGTCTKAHPEQPVVCRLPKDHDGPHLGLHVYDIDQGRRSIRAIRSARQTDDNGGSSS